MRDGNESFLPILSVSILYHQVFFQTDRETMLIGASVMQQKLRTMPEESDTYFFDVMLPQGYSSMPGTPKSKSIFVSEHSM